MARLACLAIFVVALVLVGLVSSGEISEEENGCSATGTSSSPVDLIMRKKDGLELTGEEISNFFNGFYRGKIPDYQMSAMLMAICIRGMTELETAHLTKVFQNSGETLDLSHLSIPSVDKHSTGGVGDKISLILAPLVASLGVAVPMMTGRGLGHTGGTLDKLESVPGVRTALSTSAFLAQLESIGLVIAGPTESVAPMDRSVYNLRDVTGTTASLPLIVSSIMSKKLSEGTSALLLDVKTGSGAFMKELEASQELARLLVSTGEESQRNTVAVLTNHDQPLGRTIGNMLELAEAVEVLKGGGPEDIVELVTSQCAIMLLLAEVEKSYSQAFSKCTEHLHNGMALAKLVSVVSAQGGDAKMITSLWVGETNVKYKVPVTAEADGYVSQIDTFEVGMCSIGLGAGRITKDATIDFQAGMITYVKLGQYVKKGDVLVMAFTNVDDHSHVISRIRSAYVLAPEPPTLAPLIVSVVVKGGLMDWDKFVESDGALVGRTR